MKSFTQWTFFRNPQDAWDAMYADCEAAERTIDVEQYIIRNDETGKRFLELFVKLSKRGVRIRILCDMIGSIGLYHSSWIEKLHQAGIQLQFFNPISPWKLSATHSWFFRDHRKILVVDSSHAHIGSLSIDHHTQNWRETNIRFNGMMVSCVEYVFERMWENTMMKLFYPFRRELFSVYNSAFTTNSPKRHQRFFYWQLIDAIRSSRELIQISTPYFIPDIRLLRTLRLAVRRGVDVQILLPASSDVTFVDWAARAYFKRLLTSGIRIFLFQGGRMHAKTAAIDHSWATVGSTNIDNRSLLFSYEANLVTTEAKFVQELHAEFLQDLSYSTELQNAQWSKRSVFQKSLEWITFPLRNIL